MLRPVREITATARRASEQHLGERLALAGPRDELKELADTFDDMLERLDAAFATQRRFVANASHELRTPLTVMRTAIDVTLAKPSPTARQLTGMAVRVRRSIDKAESMIEALLTIAVSDQGKLSSEFTDLATLAEDAIDAAAPEIERLNLRVEAKLDPAETTGDPQLLERMIANLVGNAVRHNEAGGWIRLCTGSSDAAVHLEIANSGPFVPDDAVPSLFEPFRRMEARTGVRDGVGLGLSIARSVATAHRATVTARSQPDGGLDISVVIPRRRTSPPIRLPHGHDGGPEDRRSRPRPSRMKSSANSNSLSSSHGPRAPPWATASAISAAYGKAAANPAGRLGAASGSAAAESSNSSRVNPSSLLPRRCKAVCACPIEKPPSRRVPSTALMYARAAGPGAARVSITRGAHGWRSITPRAASAIRRSEVLQSAATASTGIMPITASAMPSRRSSLLRTWV